MVHSNLVTINGFECISGNNIALGNLLFLYFILYLGRGQVSKYASFLPDWQELVILKCKQLTVKASNMFLVMFFCLQ